jgi:hypothetical protein
MTVSSNVVVELLTLLFRILEIPGSNIGSETGYPEVFRGLPQSLHENAGTVLKIRHQPFPSTSLHFTIHSSPFHSTLYTVCVAEKSVVK